MSRLTKRAINLTAEKRALLEALLREEGVEPSTPQRIPRRKDLGPVPLSFAQQRLWFLDQLSPGNAAYNIPEAIRLSGRLDTKTLEESLSEIVRRHEVLRTSFPTVGGMPVQEIAPPQPVRVPVIDLTALPEAEREARAESLASEEAARPFDLQRGPLLRAALLRLGAESHVLLFTMHHIISDAWSMEVLVREVASLYEAFSRGEPSPLGDLPLQYADFALWQRGPSQAALLDRQLSYWERTLAGAPSLLELPTDRPRPAAQTYRGASLPIELGRGLTLRLRELAGREGVTLFMALLAAYRVLLYRLSGRGDVSVGVPIAGRNRAEVEGLIGFFVNTLVMRGEVRGWESFEEVMRREREVVLGAFGNQEVPFERVVEQVRPERSLSYSPLFQVA
ncbi:MAG TPA: condensation domain-containing protein, partial [Blastocatellia bacterium]|nr:condensation domain-containing protein [Blastocatellia bacterium]